MWYKYDGSVYNGTLYTYDSNTPTITTPDIESYWLDNYTNAASWLYSRNGVKGVIITDTHYGASKAQFTNSQAVRSAKRIQSEQSDVLLLHLGDIVDNSNTELTRFESDGCSLFSSRNIYLTGNHERQERTDRESVLYSYMDGITLLDEDYRAFYKDVNGIRFICINANFSGSGAVYSEIQSAVDTTPADYKVVFLSHYTPQVRDNYTLNLSIFDNVHSILSTLSNRFVGHWTGHQHFDDHYVYDNGVNFVTLTCDYCNSDYSSWRTPRTLTEGAMTCFCIHDTFVEFARFGGILDNSYKNWNYTF